MQEREILFRAKRKDNGEWVEGYLLQSNLIVLAGQFFNFCRCDGKNIITNDSCLVFCEVFPETVGQYTGLTDKNGVKIFEGDIIRERIVQEYKDSDGKVVATDEEVSCGVVKFGEYSYLSERFGDDRFTKHIGFYVDWVVKNTSLRQDLGFWANVKWCDVFAGNIHDNPEVLEEDSEYQFEQWCAKMDKENL